MEAKSTLDGLPTRFGSGWISGVLAVLLAGSGLGAVICFLYWDVLTMEEAREHYARYLPYIRGLVHVLLVAGFLLGVLSISLRKSKILGVWACLMVLVAALLGGSQAALGERAGKPFYLGLDYFLLSLIITSAIFVPLERLFGRRDQPIFRNGFWTDMTYFFISTLAVQFTTLMTLAPAMVLFEWAQFQSVQTFVKELPWVVQFLLIMLSTDIVQYWVHRTFHVVPWLWKFHAVHHSTDAMDWLAGTRLHVVEQILTRALTFIPVFILGFHLVPMAAYVVFITFHATFIHANVRFYYGPLKWLIATPQFHHWHHAIEREAIDKNFAVHFPVLDLVFGTFYLPDQWPSGYGIHDKVPRGWLRQFFYPFLPQKKSVTEETPVVQVHE
ncbi:MAG: sterol desaturase family protein [Planctomycetaceae bacterium]|nr:sterol desaturase family protein [Planctomycetaceae bacterium]